MQTMPRAVLDRLRADVQDAWLIEDYAFDPAALPPLAGHHVIDERVRVLKSPRAVRRSYALASAPGAPGVSITFTLATGGSTEAFDVLLTFYGSFERPVPSAAIEILQDRPLPVGHTGLAWAWEDGGEPAVAAYVRGNVFVGVRAGANTLPAALSIDEALRDREFQTGPGPNPYYEAALESSALAVTPGGRVTLHAPPPLLGGRSYFAVTRGSVNRDPDGGDARYYRARLEPGDVEIDELAIGRGIVPVGRRWVVRVEAEGGG